MLRLKKIKKKIKINNRMYELSNKINNNSSKISSNNNKKTKFKIINKNIQMKKMRNILRKISTMIVNMIKLQKRKKKKEKGKKNNQKKKHNQKKRRKKIKKQFLITNFSE